MQWNLSWPNCRNGPKTGWHRLNVYNHLNINKPLMLIGIGGFSMATIRIGSKM
ncbi:hypothetical protein ACFPFV_06605 [Salinicoccus siamensis]|uniref:hypothetical protein n=1 Tax=Salinicoccus siamensis TaxID=381830 RepID=UPI00360D0AE5